MNFKLIILIMLCGSGKVYGDFDQNLYESVLDADLCQEQLNYVMNNTLVLSSFLDSGIRTPRGILKGNLVDLGNYYQCLQINNPTGTSVIQGKYCSISIPLQQEFPEFLWRELFADMSPITSDMVTLLQEYNGRKYAVESLSGVTSHSRVAPESPLSSMSMTVSVCIPQSCTTRLALETLMPSTVVLEYRDNYCRLPNDKPSVTADYVAAVIFGAIGLLTLISTAYDLRHTVLHKTALKNNPLYTSFSIFTNTRRLITVASSSNSIECLDGLRVFAISWVVLGHVYSNKLGTHLANPLDALEWLKQFHSIFISAAPITVDTFFFLSGVLVVYTTVGKVGRVKFIKNVHIFYLHRLVRMFPLLAACVLLQASWFNHVADGPYWQPFVIHVQMCRSHWWATLLYLQNYLYPGVICLGPSWYLAVDMQSYILSPIVLVWMMGSRRAAWTALSLALAVTLGAATTFNAVKGFPTSSNTIGTITEYNPDFTLNYYINTLTRISPFVVGMLFGYLLLVGRQKNVSVRLSRRLAAFLWVVWLIITLGVIGITYPIQMAWWDSPALNIIINSFMRPLWGVALGWMLYACAYGYGGPINRILSLRVWKIPARLSYGVFIFHYPIQIVVNNTILVPLHFSDAAFIFRFFADIALSFFVAFLAGVLIDAPFSTLVKLLLGAPSKSKQNKRRESVVDVPISHSIHEGITQIPLMLHDIATICEEDDNYNQVQDNDIFTATFTATRHRNDID